MLQIGQEGNQKKVGSRMEPRGIPVSTGYSRKDLASRAIQKHLLLRKVEIRPND